MYQAKEEGLGYLVFEPDMYEQTVKRLSIENDLRRAIEAEEFVVHYQPIVRLDSGEVWGVEALVRWDHPEQGLLNPSQFIPAAEESGLIVPLCERVMEEACRRAKDWQKENAYTPPWHISVNISARQLKRIDFAEVVEGVLRNTGLEARCLSLDLTETVYVKALESHIAVLDELKRKGVRISIDDFGTGYSSLSYLKTLPADILKIDKKFIKGLGEDVEDTAIVQMIIELAHTLGMEIVAEGVESEGQAKELRRMGCDMGQGYYFSEPFAPEAVLGFLREGPGMAAT
jgi:EAL domain-containing protein (putative c-di-GMP-specific phosphodiesterase class I)